MHIPDGFLTKEVFAPLIVLSGVSLYAASRRAAARLDEKTIPLVGTMSAFVFAAQMINFPVGAGVSGHFTGGALLAAIFGPAVAMLCMTAVLGVQALFFADGGLLALGANIFNMGVVAPLAGAGVFHAVKKIAGDKIGVFAAGLVSTLAASAMCAAELAVSRAAPVGAIFSAMLAVHVVIGLFEGAITAGIYGMALKLSPRAIEGKTNILTEAS